MSNRTHRTVIDMSSKRPAFKHYKQPAKIQRSDKTEDGKPAAVAAPNLSEVNIILPQVNSSGKIPEVSSIKPIEAKSSKKNLRISDSNFKSLTKFISNIESLYRQRQSIIRTHESIVSAINSGGSPGITRIPTPRPPHGHDFSSELLSTYSDKAKEFSVLLGALLLPEYKNLVVKLTSDIEFEVHEGLSFMHDIQDLTEREKAIELFNKKHQAVVRRFTEPREPIKAYRRINKRT